VSRRLLLASLLLGGCIHDSLERCGDLLCPETAVCLAPDRCVQRDAIESCEGMPDGTSCDTLLFDGGCLDGICVAPGCGNRLVDATEVCDDGNTTDGDGCAADCGGLDRCPPIGTIPIFSEKLEQTVAQPCRGYVRAIDVDRAVASCTFGLGNDPALGPWDGPLVGITELPESATFDNPQIVPEGDEIWVRGNVQGVYTLYRSRLVGDTWSALSPIELAVPMPQNNMYGTPTRGPVRRTIAFDIGNQLLREYELDAAGTKLTQIGTYTVADIGTAFQQPGNLTDDGLRMVFNGPGFRQYFSDRPTLTARFGPARLILNYPSANGDTFMSSSCDRVYFSGLQSVFSVRQVP